MTDSTMTPNVVTAPGGPGGPRIEDSVGASLSLAGGCAAEPGPAAPEAGRATLDAIRISITQLLSCLARPASAVRVSVGDVTIELHWADPPAAAGGGLVFPPVATPVAGPAPPGVEIPQQTVFTGELPKSRGAAITAPTVGAFYRAREPGATPFVEVGDVVAAGQQVAIVEAMKIMIPVEADHPGRIAEVLKADAEPVEYGEALFIVAPLA